ncbi:PilZ domain-containing protein [Persephonella sp.]|uniref:flagellar brake protein n=1 Tax=Persephonella sp. TaxID=2060922 RepID=UPI002638F761|nr:PilZ domain-containing protein [Persephonella sp.]
MEDKAAAIRSFKAATDTEATDLLIVIFIILFLVLVFLVVLNFRKVLKQKFMKKLFMKTIKEKSLSEKAGEILWKYSIKLGRDPFLSLEVKASFEKVVDQYVQEEPDYDEELIKNMRKNLGFDYIPSFIPLTSTKDIEIFQSGKITYDGKSVDVALYDKDEKFMYWVLMEGKNISDIKGKTVKIQFLRRDDAIYILEGRVEDIFTENGKTVLKIPHHSEMKRIQRRQHCRIEVDFPVSISKISLTNPGENKWITADAKDISGGGIRICVHSSLRTKMNLAIGTDIWLNFHLDGKDMRLKGTVVNILERKTTTCYGIKFVNLKSKEESIILNYVKKQQQKLRSLAKQRTG